MAERPAPPLGALEAERFFGRTAETARFLAHARALLRGWGRSATLVGPPGAGKSELLRQWYGCLFREGEVLPLHHVFPPLARGDGAAARRFLEGCAVQALAFRRRDPGVLREAPPPETLFAALRGSWGRAGVLLAEALRAVAPPGADRDALREAVLVPHRFAEIAGTPVLCLLDEAGGLAGEGSGEGLRWPQEALSSRIAPAVFAAAEDASLDRLLGPERAVAATAWPLGPLSEEAAGQLLQHLLRTTGLELQGPSRELAVQLAGGSPFALQALVRAVSAHPSPGAIEVVQAYAACVAEGDLGRAWAARLAAALPCRRLRATALELLAFGLREGSALDPARLAARMFKPESEVAEAVAGLERAGAVRTDGAWIVLDPDPVLRDCVDAQYRREFGGATAGATAAVLAAEKFRSAAREAASRARERLRGSLRAVLGAWRGQQVPAALFEPAQTTPGDARDLRAPAPEPAAAPTVTLPTVVAAGSGRFGQAAVLEALEIDAVAWGWRGEPGAPEGEVVWVARCIRGGEGSASEIEAFDAAVAALQAAGDLPGTRLMRWVVSETALDGAGAAAASRLRVSASGPAQFAALAAGLGVPLPASPRLGPPAPPQLELEMEMVIPQAADAELVAARALEQLAENLRFAPEDVGRLKMALVEACINAFEHSGLRGGRVRLHFAVGGGDLRIRVENRGRRLAALPPPAGGAAEGGAAPRRRGWGLTLIRELMDEVALEPREDGVSLVMVKRLVGEGGGHA